MSNKIEQWIEALPKYEKLKGHLVPVNFHTRKLEKENCACALGVYLIEVLKQDPKQIASSILDGGEGKYWEMLHKDLGTPLVMDVWETNDNVSRPNYRPDIIPDDTFNTVIEVLKEHV